MIDPSTINLALLPSLPLQDKAKFPKSPAIYFAIDSFGGVQYIGRTINVCNRWTNHHHYPVLKAIGNIKIAYLLIDALELLPEIENVLIQYFNPPLNWGNNKSSFATRLYTESVRKTLSARIDERIIDGLNELAKKKNSSANRLLENTLLDLLIREGILNAAFEPLGETRGALPKND